MITIGVEGDPSGTITRQLRQRLKGRARITPQPGPAEAIDVLVSAGGGHPGPTPRAGILVADGEHAARAAQSCKARSVVTVGLSPRDTLTPSSMLSEGIMATLQRQLTGLDGGAVQPREVDLAGLEGDVHEKMIVAATLLLVAPPEPW